MPKQTGCGARHRAVPTKMFQTCWKHALKQASVGA